MVDEGETKSACQFQDARTILSKNKIAAQMIEDLKPNQVACLSKLGTPLPGTQHRFSDYNEGDLETLIFLGQPEGVALLYVTYEIMELSSPISANVHLIAAGHLEPLTGKRDHNEYTIQEYSLSKVNDVVLSADQPLTPDILDRLGWFHSPALSEIAPVIMALQNWVFTNEESFQHS